MSCPFFRDDKRWLTWLTTRDEAEAQALLETLRDKGQIEQFKPPKSKRR